VYRRSEAQADGSVAGSTSAPGFRIARAEGPHVVEPGQALELKIPGYRPPRESETVTIYVEYTVDGVPGSLEEALKWRGGGTGR
jgi:hypothetical protein